MWNVTGFTTLQDFLGGTNTFTGGWFWTMMLIGISAVIFMITSQKTTSERALITTGLGSWLFGTFFFFLGWINWLVYCATIIVLVCGVVFSIVRHDQEI